MDSHSIIENALSSKPKMLGVHLEVTNNKDSVCIPSDPANNHIDLNHQNENEDNLIREDPENDDAVNSKFDEDELLKDDVEQKNHVSCVSNCDTEVNRSNDSDNLKNVHCANKILDSVEDRRLIVEQNVIMNNEGKSSTDDDNISNTSQIPSSICEKVTASNDKSASISEMSAHPSEATVNISRNDSNDPLIKKLNLNPLSESTFGENEHSQSSELEQPMDVDSDCSNFSKTVSDREISNVNDANVDNAKNVSESDEQVGNMNSNVQDEESEHQIVLEKSSAQEELSCNVTKTLSDCEDNSKELDTSKVPHSGNENNRTGIGSVCSDGEDSKNSGTNKVSRCTSDDTRKNPNTEVLHIDQNEDDAEMVMDTGAKDPFGQENEGGDVEPNTTREKESEIEPMDVDHSADPDENETSRKTDSKIVAGKESQENGKTTEIDDGEDENCIIPDAVVSSETTKDQISSNNKQIRKFDITPVRLEKLMDPMKLASSAVSSSEQDRSVVNSGRPQRRAAKKAESQIKEMVSDNDTDQDVEEPKQTLVCCRCSRLRYCKYVPTLATFACIESCYKILTERIQMEKMQMQTSSTPAPTPTGIRVASGPKVHQSVVQQHKPVALVTQNILNFWRKCAHCNLRNIVEEKCVSWEAMDFCNEDCLSRYQTKHGTYCAFCKNVVQHTSMGKYAVRFGLEARQFCSGACLEEFKKGLKSCGYCQKDITKLSTSLRVASGDKQQLKDFCSVTCKDNYECMSQNLPLPVIDDECTVCSMKKAVEYQVVVDGKIHPLCSDVCFSAFNFANNISDTDQCNICKKYFEENSRGSHFVYHEDASYTFCSKICMNVFILFKRKIVPCNWCKVKKYNFDMIRKSVHGGGGVHMCSINCLTLYQVSMNASSARKIKCDFCSTVSHAQYHLTMSDATIRNFCSYNCVMVFQAQYSKAPLTVHEHNKSNVMSVPVPLGAPTRAVSSQNVTKVISGSDVRNSGLTKVNVTVANGLLPQITSTSGNIKSASPLTVVTTTSNSQSPVISAANSAQVQPQTKYIQHIIVKPPEPKEVANKITQCHPTMVTKGISCKSELSVAEVETQTDEYLMYPPVLPIPVPIYVPVPMHMFTTPFPIPVPFPLTVPVPIFIPTTQKTFKGLVGRMKEIIEKTPMNPYEADLLLMAKMVAGADKPEEVTKNDSSNEDDTNFTDAVADLSDDDDTLPDTENSASTNFNEAVLQMALEQLSNPPTVDLEAELTSNTITPQTQVEENNSPVDVPPEPPVERPRTRKRQQKQTTESPARKRGRQQHQQTQQQLQPSQQQQTSSTSDAESLPATKSHNAPQQSTDLVVSPAAKSERPDASMCLKYTIGVRGWKQWVIQKNEQIEQAAAAAGKKAKTFNTNILKLTTDELNYLLCRFVKEVRKPNGMEYAPDTIYYLCLSIQQYLFENGRIDNIFTDSYYEQFTDALDEVAKKFSEINDTTQFILTRVEEEHLWESKQLGAHSPHVLLATLMFFNTKYFNLATLEEHMQLSFSHIMKHWKRSPNAPAGKPGSPASNRNVVLRFYPPQAALDAPNSRKKKVYEQHESEVNPLRCPVKLYEFYLSKCPESVKQRNDVFYLQPERSCVPDSPVWYSTMPLQKELLMKMLHRIRMVKEVNIALLAS